MYLNQELRLVTEYRQTEALKRIHWLHSLMGMQPGFIRTLACRYPGSPDRYAWFRFWTSPAGNTDFRQTPEAKEFSASRPEGVGPVDPNRPPAVPLYGPLPGGIADNYHWQSVIEPQGMELGSFLVRSAFRVGAGRDAEFIENRREFDKLALESPGIMSTVAFRCSDAGSDLYLSLLRGVDREAYNDLLESQAAVSLRGKTPSGLYETLTTECFLIIDEVLPTKTSVS